MSCRLVAIVLVLVCLASTAWAQPEPPAEGDPPAEPGPAKSDAEVLFDQGLSDMQAGNYGEGCPALAESYRLEPLPGVLFTLAECMHKWGKLATAQSRYLDYLSQVKRMAAAKRERQGDRPKVAEEALQKLEGDVPTLTIALAAGVPSTAVVKRNGTLVPPTQLGRAIPVDPGPHELTLDVPGEELGTRSINLAVGEHKELELDVPAPKPTQPEKPPEEEGMSPMRTAAYVVGAVGIAGVVTGVVAGAIAINRSEAIEPNCDEERLVCNETGISKVETVREAGNTATVAFAIGAAGLAVGITLWLLSEPTGTTTSALVVDRDGFGFRW